MTPTPAKQYKATNNITGEEVQFDWSSPKPPTQDDVNKISDEQRKGRLKVRQQQVDAEDKTPFMDKLLMSKPVGAAIEFGKNFEWHPIKGLQDIGEGMQHVLQGTQPSSGPPVAHPRLAGAEQAARGAMGVVGPPAVAAGMIMAPEVTAPAMAASTVAGPAAESLTPDDWSPEARHAVGMGASLAAGYGVGHAFAGSMAEPPPVPPEVADTKTGELVKTTPFDDTRVPPQQKTGVNYNEPPRFSQQQLPPVNPLKGGQQVAPDAAPPAAQETQGPMAPQPQQLPPVQAPPQLPPAQTAGQLPRGPIQAGPVAPIQQGPGPGMMGAGYDPRGTMDEPQAPAPRSAQPTISAQAAKPLSTTDVSTVSAPAPDVAPNKAPPPPPPPPLQPPQQPPQGPGPVGPVRPPMAPQPQVPPQAPARPPSAQEITQSPQFQAEKNQSAAIDQANLQNLKVAPPAAPQKPAPPMGPVTPPPTPSQLRAMGKAAFEKGPPPPPPSAPAGTTDIGQARSKMMDQQLGANQPSASDEWNNIVNSAVPAEVRQVAPPPPTPINRPGPVAPLDMQAILNKAGVRSSGEQTSPGPVQPPGAPPAKPVEPQISPQQQIAAKANNDVLDMLKMRKNVTTSQIQNKLGLSGDVVKQTLASLKQRGLVSQKGATFNYNRMSGEELPETPKVSTPPPPAQQEAPISEARQTRIGDLQKMMGQAEDEGDDPEPIRHLLDQEEKAADIERHGTPEQKAALKERDDAFEQARALEDKEDSGQSLSAEETQQLKQLYKRINAMSINDFFRSEEGSSPSVGKRPGDDLNRSFFERWAYQAKNAVNPPEFADIRGVAAELRSPNRVLRDSGIPGAVEIGKNTPKVEVKKYHWLGNSLRNDVDALRDLSPDEMEQAAKAVDVPGVEVSDFSKLPPKVKAAAVYLKGEFDKMYNAFPKGAKKGGEDIGQISGYLPHMAKVFGEDMWYKNAVNDAAQYFLGAGKGLTGLFTRDPIEHPFSGSGEEGKASLWSGGVNQPRPGFTEERTGAMKDYTYDLKRVIPMYRKLAAKLIFDKPWIDQARTILNKIPAEATQAREMAEAYLKNYADTPDGYDAIRSRWDAFTQPLMRAHARSLLGLSTRLFSLHAARLLSQIYPEVPTKYFLQGALDAISSPIESYQDLGRRGVLPSNTIPWFFERPGAKLDRILQAASAFDAVPDTVGWHGLKRTYMGKGFDETTAENMATDRIMDLSMRSTPARMQLVFNQHGFMRPFLQYKQQIFKIAEQYLTEVPDAARRGTSALREGDFPEMRQQYGRLMRYIFGVGATAYLGRKLGIITTHLGKNIIDFGGGAYKTIGAAIIKGANGNPGGALEDLGLSFLAPAGHEISTIAKTGTPTIFEKEAKPKPTSEERMMQGSDPSVLEKRVEKRLHKYDKLH